MDQDVEVAAMDAVAKALAGLDEAARARVISWAASRYMGKIASRAEPDPSMGPAPADGAVAEFETFAELFDQANPQIEKDKVLVGAYWMQICEGQSSFPAQALNACLKDLGHGVGNVTQSLEALKADKPAMVLQLKKSGTTKQARKTYKLTQEGAKRVRLMMAGSSE